MVLLSACGPLDEHELVAATSVVSTHEPWHVGWGPLRGHADITRIAVDLANIVIAPWLPFPYVASGDNGWSTMNPLIRGNYETDFPGARMLQLYDRPIDTGLDVAP